MSTSYEIDYLLPVTAVQFDIVTTVTTVQGLPPKTDTTADVSVIIEGDTRSPQSALIITRWLNDIDATISLLPELRLSSVTAESTGRLGDLIAAGVKVAATVGQTLWHVGAHNASVSADELKAACPRRVSALPATTFRATERR